MSVDGAVVSPARVLTLTLPWPPSVNTYWRHPHKGPLAGRHLISDKGRAYRADVAAAVSQQLCIPTLLGRLRVSIAAHAPDRRRRDLDNLPKGVLDALTHASVWADDEQIDALAIERRERHKGGYVIVTIAPMRTEILPPQTREQAHG